MTIKFILLVGIFLTYNVHGNFIIPNPLNIFILAGQSNMAGRGGVKGGIWDGIVPQECQPNKSILRLSGNGLWEEAIEPLHKDIDVGKPAGIRISSTLVWARIAVKSGGILRGILWYQGESDTVLDVDAFSYKEKLKNFFLSVRADLFSPFLPIIQVAIISGNDTKRIEIVRQAQFGTRLPNVQCVDPKGFDLLRDRLHLTTPSQVKLGQMLADTFLKSPAHPVPAIMYGYT
ncbi:OLC1v1016058C1 [Oldenlandia corymbosa var. corymbosa]|uniref:OLC1v1016058C1 n=1 Tax=Oldenlandia corymbosa var. corymbosa TaxID=529605 RepID=A0AAV1E6L0_OLDCO|nr:OLC1v1016058C1 [Oldenlandia corymbosa var. corymbosa]